MQPTQTKTHSPSPTCNQNSFTAFIKHNIGKPSAGICSCGCIIPKKGTKLSGGPQYKQGYHVHCPQCGRTVTQFINPSETR